MRSACEWRSNTVRNGSKACCEALLSDGRPGRQRSGQLHQYPLSRLSFLGWHDLERFENCCLHRALSPGVQAGPLSRERKRGYASVCPLLMSTEQPQPDQALQYAGQRARMNMKDSCELTRGESREQPHDSQHHALRAGQPQVLAHSLRLLLQSMHDCPEELHEPQDVWQLRCASLTEHGS